LRERAVVMWRTHADTMPDEAAALSVLALADLHDAAEHANAPWTLLLDEFGAVINMAAQRGVAILQRGRSHCGQVIVITQSAADIEALTGQPGLLASLTDNFAGVVALRQTSPESRDWRQPTLRTRQRTPRTRVPDRLRHIQRAGARGSGDLHAARRRPRHSTHPSPPARRQAARTDRPRRLAEPVRSARPPRGHPPRTHPHPTLRRQNGTAQSRPRSKGALTR
jgi:hypothetical protein